METVLCIEVPDMSCTELFRVYDASAYHDIISTNGMLRITPPGFEEFFTAVAPGFDFTFTSILLLGTPTPTDFPDGGYLINYSVEVAGVPYIYEAYHFRISLFLNCLYQELCKVIFSCDKNDPRIKDLYNIRMYAEGAVARAETCGSIEQANAMLEYAKSLLKKYQSGSCKTC